jgi:CubicO group peptidase (beta-lactamase class C family)
MTGAAVRRPDRSGRAADVIRVVDEAVAGRVVPGAVLAAGIAGQALLTYVAGAAQDDTAGWRPMTIDTVFDLASLTKVVATTPVILQLVAAGQLGLDEPVAARLPGFIGAGKEHVTVRQLLTHTAGLPPHREYYERGYDSQDARAAALAEPLIAPPGTACVYSDIGFIVLGELAAAAGGAGLAELAARLVFAPLGMTTTLFRPPHALASRIAATETYGGVGKTGVVHDENAELLGGVAGHAGLFATSADLCRYAGAWTSTEDGLAPGWLPASLRAEAVRCQTPGLDGRRGLGWGLRGDRWDNMGDGWPSSGAGHTGFTGTSVSLDPVSGLWAVLLTNGVHYGRGRPGNPVVSLRKKVHAAVADAFLSRDVG